jgi:hypothetical protein
MIASFAARSPLARLPLGEDLVLPSADQDQQYPLAEARYV